VVKQETVRQIVYTQISMIAQVIRRMRIVDWRRMGVDS
jgi:hypothetical protein